MHGSTVTGFRAKGVQISLAHGSDTFLLNGIETAGYPLGFVRVNNARYLAIRATSRNDVRLQRI